MNFSTMHGVQMPPGFERREFVNWAIEGGRGITVTSIEAIGLQPMFAVP